MRFLFSAINNKGIPGLLYHLYKLYKNNRGFNNFMKCKFAHTKIFPLVADKGKYIRNFCYNIYTKMSTTILI